MARTRRLIFGALLCAVIAGCGRTPSGTPAVSAVSPSATPHAYRECNHLSGETGDLEIGMGYHYDSDKVHAFGDEATLFVCTDVRPNTEIVLGSDSPSVKVSPSRQSTDHNILTFTLRVDRGGHGAILTAHRQGMDGSGGGATISAPSIVVGSDGWHFGPWGSTP